MASGRDISRAGLVGRDPALEEETSVLNDALRIFGCKSAISKMVREYERARSVNDARRAFRAKKIIKNLRGRLKMWSEKVAQKSDLNPHAPAWIPQRLRRPRMRRYHAVNTPDEIQGVQCAQQ